MLSMIPCGTASLGPTGISCPPCVTSHSLVPPQPLCQWGGVRESEKVLTLCEESSLLSSKENAFELSTALPAQMQNLLPYQLLGRKSALTSTKSNYSCNYTLKFGESPAHIFVSVQGRDMHAITIK